MAKMGRPKSDNPKLRALNIRLTETDYQRLLAYAQSHNLTITEVVRKGIEKEMKEP